MEANTLFLQDFGTCLIGYIVSFCRDCSMNFNFILLLFFMRMYSKFILCVCVHSGIQIQFIKNQLQM